MDKYPKEIKLKNGDKVSIREFRDKDMEALIEFLQGLSIEDRMYLRSDVMDRENIIKRFGNIDSNKMYLLVVWFKDRIIAQCNISRAEFGWKRQLGEIRIVVDRNFQRLGLCTALTKELFLYALTTNMFKIQAEIMENQKSAMAAFERMGFKKEAVLQKHVTDINDKRNNLIILSLDIQDMWYLLEDFMSDRIYVT